MKKNVLRIIAAMLLTATVFMSLPFSASAGASEYDKVFELVCDGIDCATDKGGKVFVYPNKTDSVRSIKANEYNFYPTSLMVFDKNGLLIECGKNLLVNDETRSNAPQEYLNIPSGGFAIAFNSGASNELNACFATAMEGAMLYNATMSVIYEVKGSFDEATKKIKIEYNSKKKPSDDAVRFLFVGNSSTYFNGTPLKFKALALAAGKEVDVTYCTFGAAYLSEFADETHERGKALRTKLNTGKFDFVVLQDAGGADYSKSKPALDVLVPLIKEKGATPLLYMRYSGEKVPENRKASAKVHYDNYTRLASDFSLTVAPAAESFFICNEKYPDINLYADDKAHHSKEASYLIACIWLYRYLGIDPRGNTYDAQLDKETASRLQECAYLTCEVGYFDPKPLPVESSTESFEENVSDALPNGEEDDSDTVLIFIVMGIAVIAVIAAVLTVVKNKKK